MENFNRLRNYTLWGVALAGLAGLVVLYRSRRAIRSGGGGGLAKVLPLRGGPSINSGGTVVSDSKEKKFGNDQEKRDVIDEASWESFPASDSPAW